MKRRRMDLGLTQRRTASILGVSDTSLRHWEEGVCEPHLHQIPQINRFLELVAGPQTQCSLGERLRAWRRAHGLALKTLAPRLGLDWGTLNRLERGTVRQPSERVTRLVRGLIDRSDSG